ncbi:O-acetylhomoserine aminocarboxypropyltransferase [Marivibrio halodurans]|uniref:O-succinylhomoserine sulfhydrylase n=1 Tax=Marivibrio halodurans TaxID=2039722 RepID=A0A8J7SMV9_9PROT|nr:O-acetylhomoserine aminocarboxypropyltransferase [Marivibrio halodurans]MBP5857226.1 O-acetylhomoserine aminocarboxypropyltransferase [Marivibrio halodurans]
MAKPPFLKFDTRTLHAGQQPDPTTGARAVPIYQTTSYMFDDVDHAAALFNLERPGHIYSRISNPTVAVLEERLASLEGGVGAIATASGHAAVFLAIATLMGQGGHIVASRALYGGSINLFLHTLPRFGITATLVDPRKPEEFEAAIRPETRLVFSELIGNPNLDILDIEAVAEVAHRNGLPLMIDGTFNTPYLCRPFEHGADLMMHSLTKWCGGHGIVMGGALIDGGTFDWWGQAEKWPTLTEPYAAYHGIVFAEEYGPAGFIMRARAEGMRDFGAVLPAQSAFYLLQGLETLPLRMDRHVANAEKVATFLAAHEAVEWVNYPGLESHPDYALARKYLPKGAGSMLAFGVKGGREAGAAFIQSVEIFSHLANVGDAKSLVLHPASTTHQQMTKQELKAAGIGDDLIRVSVGLEDIEDLLADLDQALKRALKATGARDGKSGGGKNGGGKE